MKLIERLKKEYSDKLEINNLTYPTLVDNVCRELEEISLIGILDMELG